MTFNIYVCNGIAHAYVRKYVRKPRHNIIMKGLHMKHARLLATSAALVTLALAACGGTPATEPAPTTNAQASTQAVQQPTALAPAATTQPEATDDVAEQPTAATADAAATMPADWMAYTVTGTGLRLALPPSWQQLDMDEAQLDKTIATMKEKNPQLADIMGDQARTLMQQGIKFFGFDNNDEAAKRGFATNINVISQDLPMEVNVDQVADASLGQLEQLPNATKPETQKLTLSDGTEAMQVKYGFNINNEAGQTLKTATTQYFTVKDKTLYVVTLTTTDDQAATYEPIFSQVAQTIAFSK